MNARPNPKLLMHLKPKVAVIILVFGIGSDSTRSRSDAMHGQDSIAS